MSLLSLKQFIELSHIENKDGRSITESILAKRSLQRSVMAYYPQELSDNTDALFVGQFEAADLLKLDHVRSEHIAGAREVKRGTRFCIGNHDDFITLCHMRRNVFEVYLDKQNCCLVWLESNLGADLRLFTPRRGVKVIDSFPANFNIPATVIFADHGMGKTTYFKQIKASIERTLPNACVIRVDDLKLHEYLVVYKTYNVDNFMNFLGFNQTKKKIYLLVDNFENLMNVDDIINVLFNCLLRTKNVKIWLSCSKPVVSSKLELKFGTFAHFLSPLTLEFQKKYLTGLWGCPDIYVSNVLKICNNFFWGPTYRQVTEFEFSGYPLHLEMISFMFRPSNKTNLSKVNVLDIFELYIEENYKVVHVDKLAVVKLCKNVCFRKMFKAIRLPTYRFNFTSVVNYLAAKWFSQYFDICRLEFYQFISSELCNWQFTYFMDRFLCRSRPLHNAVINRNIAVVEHLCRTEDVNAIDAGGRTALFLCHNVSFAKQLIKNGAFLNISDSIHGYTVIESMEKLNKLDIVNLLLQNGVS